MTILGLETSTAVCSVGLFRDGENNVERSLRESHIHSEKLLTLVQDVMAAAGISLKHLDAIAVSIGPGSFTGLRIGLSTAKGLSYALDKPIIAVPTFDAAAEAARRQFPAAVSIAVIVDAKKDEWYVGRFQVSGGLLLPVGPVGIGTLGETAGVLRGGTSTLILTDRSEQVARALDIGATIEDVHTYCRGDVVASLASPAVLRREFADASALEPVYLKDFVVRSVLPAV
jgi:tRNA threonylcarbamoyladenosine biosynthesis protein TsaB